jgi:hypothetical protein
MDQKSGSKWIIPAAAGNRLTLGEPVPKKASCYKMIPRKDVIKVHLVNFVGQDDWLVIECPQRVDQPSKEQLQGGNVRCRQQTLKRTAISKTLRNAGRPFLRGVRGGTKC